MKIVRAGHEILTPLNGAAILEHIERTGRVCYKSEEKITNDSAPNFVKMLIERGHEAMIEHFGISVKFICDRGVSHEIVRHRIASFAQESTRYCNYGNNDNGCTFIVPCWFSEEAIDEAVERSDDGTLNNEDLKDSPEAIWLGAMFNADKSYSELIGKGWTPQEARSVLPNSLKTEIVVTANLREWRHFFKLRCAKTAHPQMREVTIPLLEELKTLIPVVFDNITY